MKIVIIGGTGLIGSKLSDRLRTRGHEVIAAAPVTGVNTITGEGLAEVLKDTDVVVDVANSPSFEDKAVLDFFKTSTGNLLAEERSAGVKHHIALSVVGTDRLQESGYFRAKQAQESLIIRSGMPYTIVHSTQFFEFLGSIVGSAAVGEKINISPAEIQPIASDDVADSLAKITEGSPVNAIVEIAGPDVYSLAELVSRYLQKTNDARTINVDVHARYFGAELQNKTLVPAAGAKLGMTTFENWFANRTMKVA